jgi:dihydrofolate reductase
MRKLMVFNSMSLDGFIADSKGDMSWAHKQDEEWNSFVAGNAGGEGVLVFGRKTYDMMAGYWPTPMAAQNSPVVAKRMNELQKVVLSQTMNKAAWQNTTLLKGELTEEVKRLKQQAGPDLVILGSASIVAQLSDARLVDEYQVALSPILLGGGKSMFASIHEKLALRLANTRSFQNGNVFLTYRPV